MATELVTPEQTVQPVADTTAGRWEFGAQVNALSLINNTDDPVFVRFNSESAASMTMHDMRVPKETSRHVRASDIGLTSFCVVSVWFPGGDVSEFLLRGA